MLQRGIFRRVNVLQTNRYFDSFSQHSNVHSRFSPPGSLLHISKGYFGSSKYERPIIDASSYNPAIPELPDRVQVDSDTEAEIERLQLQKHPFHDPDDPAAAYRRFFLSLQTPTISSKVVKLLDYELTQYIPEEFFGVSSKELEQLILAHKTQDRYPAIKTLEPFNKSSFDTLLTLQARKRLSDKALKTFELMKRADFEIDAITYTNVLSALKTKKYVATARKVFDEMAIEGIPYTAPSCTALMESYISAGRVDEAYQVMRTFALGEERIVEPDCVMFTSLIHGCVNSKNHQLAWETFDLMRQYYTEPDSITFSLMIDVCAQTYEAERAFQLYDEMRVLSHPPTEYTFNSLLKACSRRHDYFSRGFQVLDDMKLTGFRPDQHTYHLLLSSCGQAGDLKAADLVMDKMEQTGVEITVQTYEILLNVLARSHSRMGDTSKQGAVIERAELIFDQIRGYVSDKLASGTELRPKVDEISVSLLNNYVSVYSEAMNMRHAEKAMELFQEFVLQPDIVTYNIMLKMYARGRRVEQCLDLYRTIKARGLTPDHITWRHLIEGCVRADYFNNAFKILRLMIAKDVDVTPDHIYMFHQKLKAQKMEGEEELKELVWPYPKCRVFFLRPPPSHPVYPSPPSRVRPGIVKQKLGARRWKKKSTNKHKRPR